MVVMLDVMDISVLQKIFDGCYEAGVMIRISGNNIILSPPLVVSAKNVASIINALDAGLSAAAI